MLLAREGTALLHHLWPVTASFTPLAAPCRQSVSQTAMVQSGAAAISSRAQLYLDWINDLVLHLACTHTARLKYRAHPQSRGLHQKKRLPALC